MIWLRDHPCIFFDKCLSWCLVLAKIQFRLEHVLGLISSCLVNVADRSAGQGKSKSDWRTIAIKRCQTTNTSSCARRMNESYRPDKQSSIKRLMRCHQCRQIRTTADTRGPGTQILLLLICWAKLGDVPLQTCGVARCRTGSQACNLQCVLWFQREDNIFVV